MIISFIKLLNIWRLELVRRKTHTWRLRRVAFHLFHFFGLICLLKIAVSSRLIVWYCAQAHCCDAFYTRVRFDLEPSVLVIPRIENCVIENGCKQNIAWTHKHFKMLHITKLEFIIDMEWISCAAIISWTERRKRINSNKQFLCELKSVIAYSEQNCSGTEPAEQRAFVLAVYDREYALIWFIIVN